MYPTTTVRPGTATGDPTLLERIQRGESGAMEAAIEQHGRRLSVVIHRIVGDRWAAEDLVQDVFTRLFTHADTVQSAASLGPWLRRVARNLALTYLRDHRVAFFAQHALPDEPPPPDRRLEQREELRRVHRAVERLDEPFRTTFTVCAIEGRDYASAAELLGCKKTTVNTRMFRSWQRLRAMVGRA